MLRYKLPENFYSRSFRATGQSYISKSRFDTDFWHSFQFNNASSFHVSPGRGDNAKKDSIRRFNGFNQVRNIFATQAYRLLWIHQWPK